MKTSKKIQRSLPPSVPGPAPWLVFPCGTDRKKQTFFTISNPKITYITNFHEIREKECLLSMHGWLLMRNVTQCQGKKSNPKGDGELYFLWNPVTRQTIYLPSRNWQSDEASGFFNLTSAPTCSDCMVLFVGKSYILSSLVGGDSWTKHQYTLEEDDDAQDDFIDNVVTSNGTRYAVTFKHRLAIIEIAPCGALSVKLLDFDCPQLCHKTQSYSNYTVESCGDIYHIVVHFLGKNIKEIDRIQIFRLDISKEDWMEVVSIGEQVFVLSDYGCMSCSGTKSGMKGNNIYFTFGKDKKSLYVYSLEDESLTVSLPFPELRKPFFSPFWLMPTKRVDERIPSMESSNNIMAVTNGDHEESRGPQWIDLPLDSLSLILKHIPSAIDYRNLRAVCKTMASSIPPVFDPIASTTRCPWLMYFNNEVTSCNFLDPMTSITHTFEIPELLGSRICFSDFGWLLMSQGDRSMFFFNPFDMATIELPDLPQDFAFNGLSFSCSPTSSDCIIFGAHSLTSDKVDICYLHVGEDDWTSVQFKNSTRVFLCDNNPVFLNGAFYCLSYEQHLGVFHLENGVWIWTVHCTNQPCKFVDRNYLVQYDGKLLSVFVGPKGKWVNIQEFNIQQNKWWLVTELSDQTLFVSRRTTLAMRAVSEGMQNKIYFPLSSDGPDNYVYYCLETKRWHSSFRNYRRSDIYFTRKLLHCTWIQPTLLSEDGSS